VSGSGLPLTSMQISAVSSRSESASHSAFSAGVPTVRPEAFRCALRAGANTARSVHRLPSLAAASASSAARRVAGSRLLSGPLDASASATVASIRSVLHSKFSWRGRSTVMVQ